MTASAASRPRYQGHATWTLVTCVLASSLSFVEGSVLNVALPAIRESYGAGAEQVQWVVNAYLLPLSALLLLGGALGDHYGRRLLLLIGTAVFAVASLACALAPSLTVLLAARAVQGVGAALLLPNSLAILNDAFSGEARGRAVGIWAAAGAGAAAVAPLIGGWLVDTVGWPAIFYINLPLAAGAVVLAATYVAESRDAHAGRTDFAGAILATSGLGALTYALTSWSASSSMSTEVAAIALCGLALIAAFLFVEHHRGAKAMMPLGMFTGRCFAGLNFLTFLLYGAFGAAMLLIPFVLIEAAGYSPVEAGTAMLPLPIVIALASPRMGALAARVGPRLPLTVGPLVVACGMLLGMRLTDGSYWTGAFSAITVMAIGMAIAVAPLTSTVLGSVEQEHVGTASGFNSAVARIGGLIATALLGAVLGSEAQQLIGGFRATMMIAAAVALLAGATALVSLGGNVQRR